MAAPSRKGKFDGEVVEKQRGRGNAKQYWKWNGREWRLGTEEDAKRYKQDFLDQRGGSKSYQQLADPGITSNVVRYPGNLYASNSDYVLFEFYEYQPPFQNINKGATKDNSTPLATYNQSATDASFYKETSERSIILYMPEDVSTGYKANWSGKSFSNIGAAALSTAGSGDVGQFIQNSFDALGTSMDQLIPNTGRKLVEEIIGKVTGEQIGQNDIFSSTRGVILNPNVELLFSGTDLRNFQLNYKLVPRNDPEAKTIKEIVKIFKRAMLPRFAKGNEFKVVGGNNIANSFIKVPNFCRVSFMRGNTLNRDVTQYKMCAITQVDINYTPDGAYATYESGAMVAIELSLAFQETKLIFAEEADNY